MDLAYEHPPQLYPFRGTPPLDAWDVQIAAPAPLVAWLERRRAAGRPCLIYGVAVMWAKTVVATALPRTPMAFHNHDDEGSLGVPGAGPHPHPHVHILVGMRDEDGAPLDRAVVERVASEAWIAHMDKLVDYARERPHLDLRWTREGIAGVDHSHVPEFACHGFYGGDQPVIVAEP